MKPAIDPAIAMPLLAANEPVNIKPIKVIDKRPPICQVIDLVINLGVVSIINSQRDRVAPSIF